MPKLTERLAGKLPHAMAGPQKHWDVEVRRFALFVGKRSKTWYYQRDVGQQTKRVLIGRYPSISAKAARQTALSLSLEIGRGAGRQSQIGAPNLMSKLRAVSIANRYVSYGVVIADVMAASPE